MTRSQRAARGQALIETAITVPVLFTLLLSFLLAMVVAQAYVDLDTATSLAAASAVSAPAGPQNASVSRDFAIKTYGGTLRRSSYLEPGRLDGCAGYTAGGTVSCTGHATLFLSRTPMAILQPLDPNWHLDIQASATGYSSPYRST